MGVVGVGNSINRQISRFHAECPSRNAKIEFFKQKHVFLSKNTFFFFNKTRFFPKKHVFFSKKQTKTKCREMSRMTKASGSRPGRFRRDRARRSMRLVTHFSKTANIEQPSPSQDSDILGGPKNRFWSLRARCENKWCQMHEGTDKCLRSVARKSRFQMPYVFLRFFVRKFFLASCFEHFSLCTLVR